jgi:anti-anti-sigma factor
VELRDVYQQFAAVREDGDDTVVVHVFGEVDIACASEFERTLDEAGASGVPIVVDLEECRYMDSTGLTALVRAVKRYGPHIEVAVAERSVIARLMQITGMEKILPIKFNDKGDGAI